MPGRCVAIAALFLAAAFVPLAFALGEPEVPIDLELVREPATFSLNQLLAIAEANSPSLQSARAEIAAAEGHAQQAGLYPNPSLIGGSDQLAGRDSQYRSTISQQIVTKGKLQLDQAAACRAVAQARQAYVREHFTVLTAVRQGFYTVLAGQRRQEVLANLVEIARKSQASALKIQRGGEGTRTDVLLLEIELQHTQVAFDNGQTQLEAVRRQLAATIGQPSLALDRVQGDLAASLLPYDEQAVRDGVISAHALVQSARLEVERSRLLLRRTEVETCPNVTVEAGYMYSVAPNHNMGIIMLDVPIPVWNRNQGNIKTARADLTKAVQAVSKAQNDLTSQLAAALAHYQVARQQVGRYEQQILPRARETLALTQQGYAQGQFDLLRLLQAQRTLGETDLAYVNAQESRWTAAAEVAGLLQDESFPSVLSAVKERGGK